MMGRRKKKQQTNSFLTIPHFTATRGYAIGATGPVSYEEKPREVKDLGLSIEPIVGLRSFRAFLEDPWTLYSFNGAPWPQRDPIQAFCGDDVFADHDAPKDGCTCGIYAWKQGRHDMLTGKLWGEVYMWGDVLIGELGYRSEFAYPKSLTIATVATRIAMRIREGLEEAYGVPVSLVEPAPVVEEVQLSGWNTFTVYPPGFAAPGS